MEETGLVPALMAEWAGVRISSGAGVPTVSTGVSSSKVVTRRAIPPIMSDPPGARTDRRDACPT